MDKGHSKADEGIAEGPAGYGPHGAPSAADLKVPVKEYPSSSHLGHKRDTGMIEGPCDKTKDGGYC